MDPKSNAPVWLKTAETCIGVKEYPGSATNPLIARWAGKVSKFLGIKYDGDHVPWCGLFATYCVAENGFVPPSIAIRASEWGKWGVALAKPSPGAIMVFTREGGGHVAFYVSEDADYYHVLGGNQGDAVSVTKIAKNRCSAIRWPAGIPLPTHGPLVKKFDGKVSTNEA
jgi:uncharacterized protein (TIGR02594 family)